MTSIITSKPAPAATAASTAFTPSDPATAFPELAPHINSSSVPTLTSLLQDNHCTHHCFFNSLGMHNHSSHQLIADLTLGATPDQLSSHYHYQKRHYLSRFELHKRTRFDPTLPGSEVGESDRGKTRIEVIGEENWKQHLGNARYYWAYLHFFDSLLGEKAVREVVEHYVFSREANEAETKMITRFYGGVLHALIHVGYGLETGMNAIVAEGLAMAAVTSANHSWLFDYDWLTNVSSATAAGEKTALLELVKQLQSDPRVSPESLKLSEEETSLPDKPFGVQGKGHGVIQEYVDRWQLGDGESAVGDLAVFAGLLLGGVPKTQTEHGGWYTHDFFLMHLNNANLFSPLYLSLFSCSGQLRTVFLRALLAQFLYYYLSRGRPGFSSANFVSEQRVGGLGWDEMFAVARGSVDEHLPKAVRALYVYHCRYRHVLAQLQGAEAWWKEEEGKEVFRLTAQQLVRMHSGQLKPTKYDSKTEREKGESVGAHQEFWSFEPFF